MVGFRAGYEVWRDFSMDFTSEREYAMRPDGKWFSRYQYRDPRYGYKWSRWAPCHGRSANAAFKGVRRVRLPR